MGVVTETTVRGKDRRGVVARAAGRRVLLAMSGGVDSSTAAVLLKEAGFEVVGCTMQLWDQHRNPLKNGQPQVGRCCSVDDVYDARRVAGDLGFPFYVLNLEKEFERRVVEPFIGAYLAGRTPLPCTLCNSFLKFDRLLVFARTVGIDCVATGHYARIGHDAQDGFLLLKGRDEAKDQSYFLFQLTQEQLARIEFPVGGYTKSEIRKVAGRSGLAVAGKRDSQEICFVPDRDYVGFIRRHAGEVRRDFLPVLARQAGGPILMRDGTRVGKHQGSYRFTIGQRRGLGVAHRRPLYVVGIDAVRNAVIVGYREDLYSAGLVAERVNWISGKVPTEALRVEVKIRSRHLPAAGTVTAEPAQAGESHLRRARVLFDSPQMAVTPGQAAVFYQGNRVLGGGWIESKVA